MVMPGDGDEGLDELQAMIVPVLRPETGWDMDAYPALTDRMIEFCGRDWFEQREKRAINLARSLAAELSGFAEEQGIPISGVEGEVIRRGPRALPDGTPTLGTGIEGIRQLIDPWLRFWLKRGTDRTVWLIIHPDGLTESSDSVVMIKQDLATQRPQGW